MSKIVSEIRESLRPDRLVPSIIAGVVAGILAITFMFSYSAVMFTEDLAIYVPRATGGMLFGGVVIAVMVSLFGAIRGAVALPQDNPTAIIAVMVGIMVPALTGADSGELVFVHVAAVIFISTLLAGIVFFILGHWHLAGLVQYIPYPVIGGFLAGTGWLLFKGSFSVMGNVGFDLMNLPALWADAKLWFPGAFYGILVTIVAYRLSHFLVMPTLIILGVLAFYAVMFMVGGSTESAIAAGYLLQPFGEGGLWRPVDPAMFADIQWHLVWDQVGGIATIVIIAVVSVLLNLTALESAFGEDIDMNRELKTASFANLGASLGGGLIGYHYVSLSTLGHRMKGDSRIVGLVVAAMCFGALTVGAGALSYFPKFILGGLVMFIGLSFLYDWVVQSWLKLSKSDFAIIMLILVVVETVGFLEAVAVGITAAAVLFVINYSRINVVRHAFSGADLHANIERPNAQRQVLRQQGGKTLILKLQGFIFFATSNGLLKTVEQKMEAATEPLSYLVIDFAHVTGLDSSALHGFVKIKQKAADHDILLVLSGLNSEVLRIFKGEKFADGNAVIDEMFDDLDQALECCETRILEAAAMDPNPEHHPIDDLLAGMFKTKRCWERFKAALVIRELKEGEFLFHKHDEENALYFVERGEFTVNLEGEGGRGYRLRRIGSGTIVGVANFFRHGAHDALVSVQAETDGTVYALTREMHEALKRDAPEVIAEFQADVLHFLSDRVADNLNVIEAVLRADE
jgi:sulfate permease, SulP family